MLRRACAVRPEMLRTLLTNAETDCVEAMELGDLDFFFFDCRSGPIFPSGRWPRFASQLN